jgi:hypothetical protein
MYNWHINPKRGAPILCCQVDGQPPIGLGQKVRVCILEDCDLIAP